MINEKQLSKYIEFFVFKRFKDFVYTKNSEKNNFLLKTHFGLLKFKVLYKKLKIL